MKNISRHDNTLEGTMILVPLQKVSIICVLLFMIPHLYRYDDMLVVPIIENTPEEKDLKDRMARAMEEYPDSCAVLVRRHGVYVWGESWEKAKTM